MIELILMFGILLTLSFCIFDIIEMRKFKKYVERVEKSGSKYTDAALDEFREVLKNRLDHVKRDVSMYSRRCEELHKRAVATQQTLNSVHNRCEDLHKRICDINEKSKSGIEKVDINDSPAAN